MTARSGLSALLDEYEAADALGLKPPTLRRWRWAGKGPEFLKIGKAVRYDPDTIVRYRDARRRRSTSDVGLEMPLDDR